jgi:hypothetical protein
VSARLVVSRVKREYARRKEMLRIWNKIRDAIDRRRHPEDYQFETGRAYRKS